ncbi:MAG: hypothetical protein ACNYPD_03775 [Candidatus Halichondribacter symbioticus]
MKPKGFCATSAYTPKRVRDYAQKTTPSHGAGRHSRSDDEDPQGY